MPKDTIAPLQRATPLSPLGLLTCSQGNAAAPLGDALGSVAFLRTPLTSVEKIIGTVYGDEPLPSEVMERRQRYRLQGVVRRLMSGLRRTNRKGEKVPYRVCCCSWLKRADKSPGMRLTTKGATFTGLQLCASMWHCPVCGARIANEWCKWLRDAIEAAKERGYKPVLVTYTAQHDALTVLGLQLDAMTKAYEAVWRGESAKRLRIRFSILGMVRTLEVTHSEMNGWHPHIHALVFIPKEADTKAFAEVLGARWQAVAARHGLIMNEHGFDATDAAGRLEEYLTKFKHPPRLSTWTEADELARWHTKKGKKPGIRCMGKPLRGFKDHLTPFQLLEAYAGGDKRAGHLFIEYALAYHGRQQCTPTTGLWEALGLEKMLTDEEAANKEDTEAKKLLEVTFSDPDWKVIRGSDDRAQALEVLERSGGDPQVFYDSCVEIWGIYPVIAVYGTSDKQDDDERLDGDERLE